MTKMMNWVELTEQKQIEEIREESKKQPVLIFKHSTRCSISRAALDRLERNWRGEVKSYYLDLLSYRSISNWIAESFGVEHESPQVLVVRYGKPVFVCAHLAINADDIRDAIATN